MIYCTVTQPALEGTLNEWHLHNAIYERELTYVSRRIIENRTT
jgi:hypothetical protein